MAFIFFNTIRYPHTLKNNIYHSNKRGPPLLFHLDTNLVLAQVLVHSVDKTHVLVVTVELIWLLFLNVLSSNFIPTQNKSLTFTWFRRSYVNCPAVILIKVTLLFCLMCAVQSTSVQFFCSCLFPMIVHLRNLFLLRIPVAQILLTPRWASRQKHVK